MSSASAVLKQPHPEFPELPAIPGGWNDVRYEIEGRTFQLAQPRTPDDFLDDPDVNAWHVKDGYMPYWSYLWPTSLEVGELLLKTPWPMGLRTLEIGTGIGLTGVVALAAGLDVVLSDYDPQSLELAAFNARRNGHSHPKTLCLDWRNPPAGLTYPFLLGCDVIYERRNHEPILGLMGQMLEPGGLVWLADPGRHSAHLFFEDAKAAGWEFDCIPVARKPYPDRPDGVTNIWRLWRKQEAPSWSWR